MASKGKILVVDDDPVLLPLLVDTMDAIGYETVAAGDGIEALELLRKHEAAEFDLLITDVKMPNMDGLTLLKKIRRHYPELPVLLITGVVTEETMAAASPDGYLCKPFRIGRLEELIENTLAARHSAHRPTPARRVLINVAEDGLRENLAEMISLSNYLPFGVSGGDEALEELERGRFDAVITSLDEATGGGGFVRRLRKKHPRLPLLLTASPGRAGETGRAGEKLKAAGYVRQPLRAGELIALLDRTVGCDNDSAN